MSIPSGISTLIFGFQWDYYHPVIIYNPDSDALLHGTNSDDDDDDDDDDDNNINDTEGQQQYTSNGVRQEQQQQKKKQINDNNDDDAKEEENLEKFYEEQRARLSRTMLDLDVEGSCIAYGKDGTHLDEITQRRTVGQTCGESIRFIDDTVAQYRVRGNVLDQPSTLWCLGDDQQVVLDLSTLSKSVKYIVFAVTLTVDRKQDLSLLKSLGCRLLLTHPGAGGPTLELCRFAISCKSLLNVNAILLGRLERIDKCVDRNSWEFIAMAEPVHGSTINHAIMGYGQGRPRMSAATEIDRTIYVYAPQDAASLQQQQPVGHRHSQEKQSSKKRLFSLHTSIRDSISNMKLSYNNANGLSSSTTPPHTGGGGSTSNISRSARGSYTGTQNGKGTPGSKEDCIVM